MKLVFLICVLVVLGCKTKENHYLQTNEIRLSPPMINASNTLIDSFVVVNAHLNLDGSKIYYTTNAEEPNENTLVYNEPLKIREAGVYLFKAFHPNWQPSETTALQLFSCGIPIDSIINISTPSEQYSGIGNNTLVNNKKASLAHKNVEWVGYDSIAKSTIILKDKKFVKSISICYLNANSVWIFPPSKISVMSNDILIKEVIIDPPKAATSNKMDVINIPLSKEITSLTVEVTNLQSIPEWHDGAGKKAWLFMDEWILNE